MLPDDPTAGDGTFILTLTDIELPESWTHFVYLDDTCSATS